MLAESHPVAAPLFLPVFAFVISYGLGYLLGSIPFGLIVTRLAGQGDIRAIGSGNIGATNVLRTGSKKLAILTLLLDVIKGYAAVKVGQHYTPEMGLVAGAAALLGHSYPVWLKYKGGKGAATSFGLSCAINLPVGLALGFTWVLVLVMVRYSSLAAITAAALSPLYAWLFGDSLLVWFYVGIGCFVLFRHRANIKRLFDGTEPTVSLGKKPPAESTATPAQPNADDAAKTE